MTDKPLLPLTPYEITCDQLWFSYLNLGSSADPKEKKALLRAIAIAANGAAYELENAAEGN